MAETGVCGELEKDEDELAQVLGDCPRATAEERAVGMAIVDDMAGIHQLKMTLSQGTR